MVAAAAAAAVAGAALNFSGSTESRHAGSTTPSRRMDLGAQNGRISYGATEKQVLSKLGAPTRKHAKCWTYAAKDHTVNGEYLGDVVDALRYCFGDGPTGGQVVMTVEEHIIPHRLPSKKWYPGGWNPAMTLLQRPDQPSF